MYIQRWHRQKHWQIGLSFGPGAPDVETLPSIFTNAHAALVAAARTIASKPSGDPIDIYKTAIIDVALVAPTDVATPAPCLVADKAMFFDGHDFIFNGTMPVTSGVFTNTFETTPGTLTLKVTPSDTHQGARLGARLR